MSTKIKKVLAVLLTAVMVISTVVVSPAAPLAGSGKYERPEPVREDTVKTTGTWTKDDKGFWSLTSENRIVSDGWYYANMLNSSTEYRWYHFDEKGIMSTGWVNDKKDANIWYYAGEAKDRTEGSMRTGWITDPQDGQRYYMDPATGMMSSGWKTIGGNWYYFAERQYAKRSWTANANGYWTAQAAAGHSYGSMYRNEMTPDGYYVGPAGIWNQSTGSKDRNKPTPTPDPVITAKADTSGIKKPSEGEALDITGLKITIYKDGKAYKTVTLPNPSVPAGKIKVYVNGEEGGELQTGNNTVEVTFEYYDEETSTSLTITTDEFTVNVGETVFTAEADTSGITKPVTGGTLDTDGLKITIYKNGTKYKEVTLPDDSIPEDGIKVYVNGVENGTFEKGPNEVTIGFTYCDPDVLISKQITTEVFTIDVNTYTVTFNANGHGTAPAQLTDVAEGAKIAEPEKPTEELYVFGGWYKEATCDKAWDFDKDTVTEDITLYAKWTVASFSVSAGTKAEFSPGLLYWDGTDSKFKFEADQTSFTVAEGNEWDPDHVNHFFWSKDRNVAVAEQYNDPGAAVTDTFFAESLKVAGGSWRTLSKAEWDYLINGRTVNGGKGYGKTCAWGTYKDVYGLIIAHDTYTGNFSDVDAAIADGCVFLPAAGYRQNTSMYEVNSRGHYWSSTLDEYDKNSVYYLYFGEGGAFTSCSSRNHGQCVRLVKSDVNVYTVSFNANGHGKAPSSIDVKEDSTIAEPDKPSEVGYSFGGWYKEESCTNKWDFATDIVTEDTMLYAKWITFSVSSSATVEFSPGLLYWDGDSFEFESSQKDFQETWDESHVNHFRWAKNNGNLNTDIESAISTSTAELSGSTSDVPFTNKTQTTAREDFTVNGETGVWRTLSVDEWNYLIDERTVNGGKGYSYTCAWGTYKDVNGLIIAHDSYTGGFTGDNWEAAAIEDGCVFLPGAGHRNGTDVDRIGTYGYYWLSSPNESSGLSAYGLYFYDGYVNTNGYNGRMYGYCVRLVR